MDRWIQGALAVALVGATSVGALWVRGDFTPVAQVQDRWSQTGEPPAPYGFGFGNATPDPEPSASPGYWPEVPGPTPAPTSVTKGRPSQQPTVRAVPDPVGTSSVTVAAPTIAPAPAPTTGASPDPIDAMQQLTRQVEQRAAAGAPPVVDVTVASFNVLGSTHTRPGGSREGMASGTARIEGVRELLSNHDVSVAGLQEFLPDQRRTFAARVPGWEMYPALGADRRTGENTVAWRSDTWDLLQPATIQVPDANGVERPLPYVLLENRATGLKTYVSTFHNPADTPRYHRQERFREAAEQREVELFNRLERTGIPHLVTGDMNERGDYFCAVTASTALTTPAGGSNDGQCRAPAHPQLDWIFGSPGVHWTSYEVDHGELARRTSDHPMVVAGAHLEAADFPNARN